MVAGRAGLVDAHALGCIEAGQQHRALHLGAGHRQAVGQTVQRRGPHVQRRVALFRLDVGAHLLQRLGDAAHRPPAQLFAAVEHRGERLPGHHPGQQTDGRARVAAVERPGRTPQPAQPAAVDAQIPGLRPALVHLDIHAQRAHYLQRRQRVAGRQPVTDDTDTLGQRGQHHGAVTDRLVAGDGDRAPQRCILGVDDQLAL